MRVAIIGKSKIWLGISAVLILVSLGAIFTKGLNLGIDFTGGNLFEFKFERPVTLAEINPVLDEVAKEVSQFSPNSRIAQVDENGILLVRTQTLSDEERGVALETIKNFGSYEILKAEKVGATVGKELVTGALWSLLLGSLLIIAYISIRFEFRFALGGIISLLHDIIIAVGIISILGFEINSSFIAAILTILGYSINDTIVVYDRIRENMKRHKGVSLKENIDNSVNEVMVRSLNTSFTTLLAVLAVLIFGGDSLKSFMVTLLVGIGIGTYSSVFVASPVVYLLEGKLNTK